VVLMLRIFVPLALLAAVAPTFAKVPADKPVSRAAMQEAPATGITGQVLSPDGLPVTAGNVAIMTFTTNRATAAIDRSGQFRLLPETIGRQQLYISVPGYAPYHATIHVPPSRRMALPPITLLAPTYFHARFATAEGEPLGVAGLRRRSIDSDGNSISDPFDHVRTATESDGSMTVGPLPPGRTMLAFDRAPFAMTRLPDLRVNTGPATIERGTITIHQGGRVAVEILDGKALPVPRHEVWIEDAVQPSPLSFPPVKTDEHGRAVFERLAPGRYRVWTQTVDKCQNTTFLTISRLVSAGPGESAPARIVIGGRATFRVMTTFGPLLGRSILALPDSPQSATPWQQRSGFTSMRRPPMLAPPSCRGATDNEGRVTMTPFPPGATTVRISLYNSTFIRRVSVPENGSDVLITLPDGLTPVKVIDGTRRQPIGGASLTWVGGGGRVEATATPNGDALLESVGVGGGTLTVSAREHETLEGAFDETPETPQEVALMASPSERVVVRVVNTDGQPIAGAVVELQSRAPGDPAEFAATDASGQAAFLDVAPGSLQFVAAAPRYAPAAIGVADAGRVSIAITLAPAPRDR
jgi:hypothetical protein